MKNHRWTIGSVALLVFCLVHPGNVLAGSPTDLVQATVLDVRSILSNQQAGAALTPEQSRQISRVISKRFDFNEMARLALGRHWQRRSPQERKKFVRLFRDLMARSQLLGMATGADVERRYVGERLEGGARAVVHTLVKANQDEIPIDYFLLQQDRAWRICDLRIDDVTLSEIYRTQFNKVIRRNSYAEVVRQMRLKLEEVTLEAVTQR